MKNKGKKAVINTLTAILSEAVSVICGLILPRLILGQFGSTYNGLTSSITQFLSVAVLLRAGIGGATRAALYKPLAQGDKEKVDEIMSATNIFMKKVGLLLVVITIFFSCTYPLIVRNDFEWFFVFSLFLIIGLGKVVESLFGITYSIFLQANQKLYVSSLLHIVIHILNTIVAAILISSNASIHMVKLGSSLVYFIYPIGLYLYVNKKYDLNFKAKPDNKAISQRWDAFWHQVSVFVMNNTDVIVLNVFSNLLEVSVYGVYNLVVTGLKGIVLNFTNGLEAAFGNMLVVDSDTNLKRNFSIIEYLIFSVATITYTCAAVLVLPFVSIYTKGIDDVNYIRPVFAYVVIVAQFFNCIRQPYQLIVQAAGHYKQTKVGAIIEPILNIVISVIMVIKFGLVGVAIGTAVATIFRTVQYSVYVNKHIIPGVLKSLVLHCVVSFGSAAAIIALYYLLPLGEVKNFLSWFIAAVIAGLISCVIVFITTVLFYRQDGKELFTKLLHILHLKTKRKKDK